MQLMSTVSILLLVWIGLLTIPVLVFLLEVAAAGGAATPASKGSVPPFAVLMPAHNEGTGIGPILKALLPQLRPQDRLLVVADNCSDNTAAIALQHGAEVIERSNVNLRGKGYALDFGVRQLALRPPAVVIIVDADCVMGDGSLQTLVAQCVANHRPVQALYLMQSPERGIAGRIAEFAWRVKNHARPLGLHRAGLPCQLMGTGMAFPWELIRNAPLASGHIVEDLQLGLDLAMSGVPPMFCPEARVTSQFAANAEGAASQRTRWEHGHLQLIGTRVPRLLWSAIRRRQMGTLALGLDLIVPPLALLALLVGVTTVGGVALALVYPALMPVAVAGLCLLLLLTVGVLLAWLRHGRDLLGLKDMAGVPFYVVRKIPLYIRFLIARQVSWIRAKRDE
jgi:cellulose synthase/poly-beta-1,6-N-acetylglucosamine synthase-like glycosyltransferase